jgi:2-dehydropantoate 2-reductase
MPAMRICIYGAGAVGGHLAARLAAAGEEVSVLARGAQLAAVREKGIILLHGGERITGKVRAAEDPASLGPQDLVIVTLKANALSSIAERLKVLLKGETPVVFAQNGIPWWYALGLAASRPRPPDLSRLDPGGALRAALPAQQVVGAVVHSANELVEPGVVENRTPGNNMIVVGEVDDRASERIKQLRMILERSGIASPPAADIRQAVWNKLVLNLGTGTLCLLTGATVAEVRGDPGVLRVHDRILAEARSIAVAHGVDPDGAPRRPSGAPSSGRIVHKPSILQDYERGRPMEIEAMLATPLAFARAANLATPTLDSLVPLAVHKAASKGLYTT